MGWAIIPEAIIGIAPQIPSLRGVLRPTVTEGDIIVRSNSNAATDGSLDGLNRDITRAREITKNKETYTDIYISPAAVKTVIDTVTNLTSELKGSADEAIKLQQDKAVQEYEKSGKPDGDLFVAMVYKGVDPNVASFLVQQEGFSDILRTQIALNDAIDANSFTQDSFNAEYQPSQSSKRQTLGQAVLLNTVKLGEFIESIPYKEEREAAKKAIQLVTGGPIKFVIAFGIDQAISYLDKVSDNVLSKGYAEVLDNITSKLWTGSYKEEHFEKIGPDGAVFKGELVTIEGEQRVMDAKRPFLAEGISAIVGLAGITKAVKGKAQESKPKSHAGDNQSNTSGAKGQGPKINGQQSDPVKVIVAKGTVKVAAGTKVAHAVEGVGSVKNISQLSPNDIRFSQNTVSFNKVDRLTGQKYTYDDLVGSMRKNGWQGDPVDVVKMQDGKLTSMDNTRIRAAREAGIDVKANVRNFTDPLTPEVQKARGWERYRTWGEALKGRIDNQSGKFGSNYPYGANDLPKVRGKQ